MIFPDPSSLKGPYTRLGAWGELKRRLPSERKGLGSILTGEGLTSDPQKVRDSLLPFWSQVWKDEPVDPTEQDHLLNQLPQPRDISPSVTEKMRDQPALWAWETIKRLKNKTRRFCSIMKKKHHTKILTRANAPVEAQRNIVQQSMAWLKLKIVILKKNSKGN